jgi:hypothetical protein
MPDYVSRTDVPDNQQDNFPILTTQGGTATDSNSIPSSIPAVGDTVNYPTQTSGQFDLFSKVAQVESPPQDRLLSKLRADKEAQQMIVDADYHVAMANLKGLENEPDYGPRFNVATAQYTLNMNKIDQWENTIKDHFAIIDRDKTAGPLHKAQAKDLAYAHTPMPIYIDTGRQEATPIRPVFPEGHIQVALGKLATTPIPNLRETLGLDSNTSDTDVLKQYATNILGPDYEKNVPRAADVISKRAANVPAKVGLMDKLKGLVSGTPDGMTPPKDYPDAKWDDTHKMFTVVRNGRLIGVK